MYVCMYHILFISQPVGGYLSCFWFLIITHKAAMNIPVEASVGTYTLCLLGKDLAAEWLVHIEGISLRNCQTFSKVY